MYSGAVAAVAASFCYRSVTPDYASHAASDCIIVLIPSSFLPSSSSLDGDIIRRPHHVDKPQRRRYAPLYCHARYNRAPRYSAAKYSVLYTIDRRRRRPIQRWHDVCGLFTVAVALIWLCVAVAISLCVLTVGLLVYRRYVTDNLLISLCYVVTRRRLPVLHRSLLASSLFLITSENQIAFILWVQNRHVLKFYCHLFV